MQMLPNNDKNVNNIKKIENNHKSYTQFSKKKNYKVEQFWKTMFRDKKKTKNLNLQQNKPKTK